MTKPITLTFTGAVGLGWRTFKSRYRALLGASAVFTLVMMGIVGAHVALNFVEARLFDHLVFPHLPLGGHGGYGGGHGLAGTPFLNLLIAVFLESPFLPGVFLFAVLLTRGESPAITTLFAGFTRYWPLVGIGALFMLLPLLLLSLSPATIVFIFMRMPGGFGPGAGGFFPVLMVFVLLLVFAVLYVRVMFAPLLCVDPRRRLGVGDGIAASWRVTGPVFWPLLGLFLVNGLIWTVTVRLFILPFVFVGLPMITALTAAAYHLATGGAPADDATDNTRAAPPD